MFSYIIFYKICKKFVSKFSLKTLIGMGSIVFLLETQGILFSRNDMFKFTKFGLGGGGKKSKMFSFGAKSENPIENLTLENKNFSDKGLSLSQLINLKEPDKFNTTGFSLKFEDSLNLENVNDSSAIEFELGSIPSLTIPASLTFHPVIATDPDTGKQIIKLVPALKLLTSSLLTSLLSNHNQQKGITKSQNSTNSTKNSSDNVIKPILSTTSATILSRVQRSIKTPVEFEKFEGFPKSKLKVQNQQLLPSSQVHRELLLDHLKNRRIHRRKRKISLFK